MTIGVLLLAAGSSRRFDGDKRLALLADGRTLLQHALQPIQASGLDYRLCLRPGDAPLAAHCGLGEEALLYCDRAQEGMGATLAQAIVRVPGWDGALIALADMPCVRADTFRCVAACLANAPVAVPLYDGRRGHPVGFQLGLFPELAALRGDRGARSLLLRHADAVLKVHVDDPGILRDIDNRAQWRALETGPAP
ncbi:MAG: nucleotidyltransferase family protein [Halioglobus sp.]